MNAMNEKAMLGGIRFVGMSSGGKNWLGSNPLMRVRAAQVGIGVLGTAGSLHAYHRNRIGVGPFGGQHEPRSRTNSAMRALGAFW